MSNVWYSIEEEKKQEKDGKKHGKNDKPNAACNDSITWYYNRFVFDVKNRSFFFKLFFAVNLFCCFYFRVLFLYKCSIDMMTRT